MVHSRDCVVGEHQQALEEFNKVALPQEDLVTNENTQGGEDMLRTV